MLGTLVGAQRKKGTFTNETTGEVIAYDNLVLSILVPINIGGQYEPIEACGVALEKNAKCAFSSISDVFGSNFKCCADLEPFMNKNIEYFFDSSKKICKVIVNDS